MMMDPTHESELIGPIRFLTDLWYTNKRYTTNTLYFFPSSELALCSLHVFLLF